MLRRRTAGVLLLTLALASGCDSAPDTSGPLPDGVQLVAAAGAGFDRLTSIRFDLSLSGVIPGLDIREVKGQVSRNGLASGQADMQESTNRFELTFQINGSTLELTDQHGKRTQTPVPPEFSPALLLDPSHGLPRLLASASGLKTEAKEDVQGAQTYRVTGEVARNVISSFVPGIQADVDVKFWVTQSEPRELVRIWMQVPPQQPDEGAVTLELALSDGNAPATTDASG